MSLVLALALPGLLPRAQGPASERSIGHVVWAPLVVGSGRASADSTPAPPTCTLAAGEPCPCHANVRNCADFAWQPAAQQCYLYCMDRYGLDIHDLDRDSDGIACEHLPATCVAPASTPRPTGTPTNTAAPR